MPDFIAAIDQGTTSTRAMIFDKTGRVIAVQQKEHRQIYPQPGWVEHEPEDIWQGAITTLRQALEKSGGSAADVAGMGITHRDNRFEDEFGVIFSLTLKDFPSASLPFKLDAE